MLSGALSAVYRTFGIKRSPRNPNICTRCSTHVEEGRMVEITVLFADLSSFTELTQELGAEKTHEVVDAFLRMATEVLVKHGAFIDKYVGDAVMALFNVPLRHEDHPLRAVAAATELSAALKTLGANFNLDLKASIGIATGFARVGRLGSDDSKDYTAIGDVVNLAARLQGKASAGEILISEESFSKHPADFGEAKSEQVALKGFREPVTAYRLRGNQATRLIGDPPESLSREATSIGAIIFGILGAPCAVVTLIGPLAVALGAGSVFGLAGLLTFLDQSSLRVPVLALTTLAALANLYTLAHAQKATGRRQSSGPAQDHDDAGKAAHDLRARHLGGHPRDRRLRSRRPHPAALKSHPAKRSKIECPQPLSSKLRLFNLEPPVDDKRSERQQRRDEYRCGPAQRPSAFAMCHQQTHAKSYEKQTMNPTRDLYRLRQAGEIFERHRHAQQQKKRNRFDHPHRAQPPHRGRQHANFRTAVPTRCSRRN